MEDKSKSISTRELWARLFQAPSIDGFLAEKGADCALPSFPDYVKELCEARGEKPEQLIKRCYFERSYGHRLFAGKRNPSRDTVLQMAFGLSLSTDGTQQLLKVARVTPLHPKVERDAVIAYGLHNEMGLEEVQQILEENDLPLIGVRHRG